MRKRLFINRPDTNARGQYNFFNDNSSNNYEDSNGLPPEADKFADKDLYSTVEGDTKNETII